MKRISCLCWPDYLLRFSQSFFKASPVANIFFKRILIGHDSKWVWFVGAMEEAIIKKKNYYQFGERFRFLMI